VCYTLWKRDGLARVGDPLFLNQIRADRALTITDPAMTRFMMSLDDAVDLVLYAFEHGEPGDLFVQKARRHHRTLAEAMRKVLGATNPIQVIAPVTARSCTRRS